MEKTWKDEYGVTYSEDKTTLIKGNPDIKEYTVLPQTKEIASLAWIKMDKLEKIVLPDGLEEIGYGAFANCSSLHSITLPSSVTKLGGASFSFTALTNIIIPEGLKLIPEYTFAGCIHLEWVTILPGLETILKNAFAQCYRSKLFFIDKEESKFPTLIEEDAIPVTGCRILVYDGMVNHVVRNYPVQRNQIFRLILPEGEKIGKVINMDAEFVGTMRFA